MAAIADCGFLTAQSRPCAEGEEDGLYMKSSTKKSLIIVGVILFVVAAVVVFYMWLFTAVAESVYKAAGG